MISLEETADFIIARVREHGGGFGALADTIEEAKAKGADERTIKGALRMLALKCGAKRFRSRDKRWRGDQGW